MKINKKGVELSLNTVIISVIVLITLIVIIAVFTKLFSKESGQLENQIDALEDEDGDQIINMFDKCPCKVGEKNNDGCPIGDQPTIPKPKSC